MNIEERLLQINQYSRSGEKQNSIKYIVIHYIGNANTSALANRNYFNNLPSINAERISKGLPPIYASSHLIVGLNGEKIRCIPNDEVAFHSGSYSMNRKSIGIETCHPDWGGRFNDVTYNSLVELTAELCKEYGIGINNVIRHFDVSGKNCPKYYVENPSEWNKFKQDVQRKINGEEIIPEPERSDEPVRVYQNGSTREDIFADTYLTKKIGSLSPYESCDCFGEFNGRAMVRYNVDGTDNYKIGFAKWVDGIK